MGGPVPAARRVAAETWSAWVWVSIMCVICRPCCRARPTYCGTASQRGSMTAHTPSPPAIYDAQPISGRRSWRKYTFPSLFVFPASLLNVEGVDAVLLGLFQECMTCLFSPCWNIAAGSLVGRAHSKDLAALKILDVSLARDDGHSPFNPFALQLPINIYSSAH